MVLLMCYMIGCKANNMESVKVILDTDFSSDADDVGAVAVLHNLSQSNDTEILAMIISSGDPWSVTALHNLNSFFGKPQIPLGTVGEKGVKHDSSYTKAIANLNAETAVYHDAVELYRKVLAEQPDNSVVLVSVGFLTNLSDLLKSESDIASNLGGHELVTKKVKHLVCMGGQYPSGKEWNFYQDAISAKTVVEQWPTEIYFVGFELGERIVTGTSLKRLGTMNPVARTYKLHNNFKGRPSWDQLAVLYGAGNGRLRRDLFTVSEPGVNGVRLDGSNLWRAEATGKHFYLSLKKSTMETSEVIEKMMF